ncbi:intraflagellar transport protein 46 [Drosophila sechellia]|uniref:Intraflagellar transport protein 46 homolog n=1 Tax=Drosophila sechellia TaxID=7238 RepID=B4I5I3_DROSE|nr:intraflagellar transport protein 46 [Drosophila sechellia]EDW55639.1 GM17080 [Drosophila sechellia]
MNFYDEEITIGGPDSKHLSSVQMESRNGGTGGGRGGAGGGGAGTVGGEGAGAVQRAAAGRHRRMFQHNSTDDDGLLQDIIDHDDEAEDSEDDDDSEMQLPQGMTMGVGMTGLVPGPKMQKRPGSNRSSKQAPDDTLSSGSEEAAMGGEMGSGGARGGAKLPHHKLTLPTRGSAGGAGRSERQDEQSFIMSPEKWEDLSVPGELKELFPYIVKYTPQTIDTPFHLQPFIPEFVPAVGDVDALLKVQAPPLLQPQRQKELNDHLEKLGLWLLDEPSGAQSEPSLLNMKLRSVLSGSMGRNPRHASSASLVPTARSGKDIEKWITEVEQVHMTQSMYDAQPRKDIDVLLEDWPRSFGDEETINALDQAYRSCLQQNISVAEYVGVLCERFGVEGPLESQADYIHNVHTLFALYLAASQAWE